MLLANSPLTTLAGSGGGTDGFWVVVCRSARACPPGPPGPPGIAASASVAAIVH